MFIFSRTSTFKFTGFILQTWMSATLQIIAVMKMLGVITLRDHSLAPVSQGTKAMDTIVQVKFFGFFQVHLKQFSTIRLSLRGDC